MVTFAPSLSGLLRCFPAWESTRPRCESREVGRTVSVPISQKRLWRSRVLPIYGLVERQSGYQSIEHTSKGATAIVLGVLLLILGVVLDISILYTLGVILKVVGVAPAILGGIGRPLAAVTISSRSLAPENFGESSGRDALDTQPAGEY